jgi:YHS domain-containing protein
MSFKGLSRNGCIKQCALGLFVLGIFILRPGWSDASDAVKTSITPANTCPVTGQAVSKPYYVEFNGKQYELCCPACEAEFRKDPEKYIQKMSPEATCVDVACTVSGNDQNK